MRRLDAEFLRAQRGQSISIGEIFTIAKFIRISSFSPYTKYLLVVTIKRRKNVLNSYISDIFI